MKKLSWGGMVLAVLALAVPSNADYYIAGSFNDWNASGQIMNDNGDGTYWAAITGLTAGARYEFKITQGTWDWNFPGANSWLYADDAGQVTITFNTNEVLDGWDPTLYRIGLSTDPGAWNIVGGFCDWNNAHPDWMMDSLGNGLYKLTKTLEPGSYEWKAVVTGSWDSISWDGRSINTANTTLIVNPGEENITFYVDALGGRIRVVPEPATMTLLTLGSLLAAIRRKK